MNFLIVDDSLDKITALTEAIYKISPNDNIHTAECIGNAMQLMEKNIYNLIIIDLCLPIRSGDQPIKTGGKVLLDEIYRKTNINIPNYILGCTQFGDEELTFSSIWHVINYEPSSTKWLNEFELFLNHIQKTKFSNDINVDIRSKVFVEGLTDKYYLEEAIRRFDIELLDKITINSQQNAGANWVANQIPIWALKLAKNSDGDYIKCVGLFDADDAGQLAKDKINNRNMTDNEKKCFSIHTLQPSYNDDILLFYKKGIKIEFEIEHLFPIEVLKFAEDKDWLEDRTQPYIARPKNYKPLDITFKDYLTNLKFSSDNLLYLKKVKTGCKIDFKNYIESIDNSKPIYRNFQALINDIKKVLKID